MAKKVAKEHWHALPHRRRWGCLAVACFVALVVVAGFIFLIWVIRPGQPVHPLRLIGADVDGLVLVKLDRSSPRVSRFLQALVEPLSYEVQSHPADLKREISQMLDVLTFREAIGLLRRDREGDREQWAWVIALRSMSGPLKILVTQLATHEEANGVDVETSGGVVVFSGEQARPCFAIAQRAIVIASDGVWLREVLARVETPLEPTPRANRLYGGLPAAGKHCIARACVLQPRQRWDSLADTLGTSDGALLKTMARVCRSLKACGFERSDLRSLTVSATVQPRGQLRFTIGMTCDGTTKSLTVARKLQNCWPELERHLRVPEVARVARPTTSTAGVTFGWTTPRIEQLLALRPGDRPTSPPR